MGINQEEVLQRRWLGVKTKQVIKLSADEWEGPRSWSLCLCNRNFGNTVKLFLLD